MREMINNKKRVYAVIILALFNFIFLGTEYLFDNMMKYVTDSKGVVIAQSYILGASVLGFIIFPFIKGCVKSKVPYIGSILAVAGYIGGVLINSYAFFICFNINCRVPYFCVVRNYRQFNPLPCGN